MTRVLIWDLPTRVFHGLFALAIVVAFAIAQFAGEHSPWFPYHMMLGILIGALLLLRVVWGFVGTRHARFQALAFSPAALVKYLHAAVTTGGMRYAGHNPGSSYAIVAMLLLAGVVVTTGLLMSQGSEAAEEFHAVAAYALMAVAVIHVLGVLWYTWRHRENISRSIITGLKDGDPSEEISSSRPYTGLFLVAIIALFAVGLVRNYDAATRDIKLPFVNLTVHLGEAEHD